MDEREEILTIVFSIVGFISLMSIIIVCICWIHRCHRQRQHSMMHVQQEYQRRQTIRTNETIQNRRKQRKKRFNTNESAISFSFNPPHLINQNVKNLDQLLANESPERLSRNDHNRGYINPITDPVYTSSSSLIPNLTSINSQQLNNLHFHYLNNLNHALCAKYEQRPAHGLRYSQSCRPSTDVRSFEYYRSMTPSISSSTESFFNPFYHDNGYKHSTLIHKAYIGHLRDDTAIFY